MGIELREDGQFVRAICSFEGTETTLEEAHIILSAIRRYFKT
jgi:hypothetical protein